MAFRLSRLNTRHKIPSVPEMSESALCLCFSQHPLLAHLRDALRLDFPRCNDLRLFLFLLLLRLLLRSLFLRLFLLLFQLVALLQPCREPVVNALRQLDDVLLHEPPDQDPSNGAEHDQACQDDRQDCSGADFLVLLLLLIVRDVGVLGIALLPRGTRPEAVEKREPLSVSCVWRKSIDEDNIWRFAIVAGSVAVLLTLIFCVARRGK